MLAQSSTLNNSSMHIFLTLMMKNFFNRAGGGLCPLISWLTIKQGPAVKQDLVLYFNIFVYIRRLKIQYIFPPPVSSSLDLIAAAWTKCCTFLHRISTGRTEILFSLSCRFFWDLRRRWRLPDYRLGWSCRLFFSHQDYYYHNYKNYH